MRTTALLGLVAAFVGLQACGDSPPDNFCDYKGACPDGGLDATLDGRADGSIVDAPPGCDLAKDPKDSTACIEDSVGVFVSPTGDETNDGSKAAPVKTLTNALTKLKGRSRIYVCEGTYVESVDVQIGMAVYGGFKCADWSYSGAKPRFAGAKPDYVLRVSNVNSAVLLEDLELDGADAIGISGASSAALFVDTSTNVTATRVLLTSGAAGAGANGQRTDYTYPTPARLKGNDAIGSSGGGENTVICPDGTTTKGGKGGDSGFDGADGTPGGSNKGTVAGCISSVGGGKGGDGSAGANGVGATSNGTLDSSGWHGAAGGDATASGSPGQGGGGGGGYTGAGGTGGAGGCGGAPGGGGKGGGISVGIIALNSTLKLSTSAINAASGGKGGAGTSGQVGQTPGGFRGNGSGGACNGGNGGSGGNGGAGGGGAGGHSIGVLWKGSQPQIDSVTQAAIASGMKGSKGLGGTPGTNDGIDGISAPTYECKAPLCN